MNRFLGGSGGPADESFDEIIALFDQAWNSPRFSIVSFWRTYQGRYPTILLSTLIKLALKYRLDQGERPTAAEYLALFPELSSDDDRALSLVYEEYCLLEERLLEPEVSEFCRRYPRWQDSLASQLGYHRDFSQIVGAERPHIAYPEIGDRFASYELRSVLGTGGAAKVYLATEDQLGGRKVVLKVSPTIGQEPSILGKLHHPNIVSVLTIVKSPELDLHGICMPYKSGITLERMLTKLDPTALPRKAASIWKLLEIDEVDPATIDPGLAHQGWADFPQRGTYTEGIAWLGLMLANALMYLHRNGIHHRDIKPANILLTHAEGPLLFDFNLAHNPSDPEHARDAMNGGTLPYMAPEQLQAFLDPKFWGSVDARADLYALGLVMHELVTGRKPEIPNKNLPLPRAIQGLLDGRRDLVSSIKAIRPDVPPALDAIISKCLSYRPEDRYETAQDLADDLQQFLHRKPLIKADNPSSLELVANWLFRSRKLFAGLGLLILYCGLVTEVGPQSSDEAPATAFDWSRSTQFHDGVELINSPDHRGRLEASLVFADLRKSYPRSAWPTLYQAIALYRTGRPAEADPLFKQAKTEDDVINALNHALHDEPHSIPLLLTKAEINIERGDLAGCRQSVDQVLQLDRGNASAIALGGTVEAREHRFAQAIVSYLRAIEIAQAKPDGGPFIDSVRGSLVVILILRVDELLVTSAERLDWSEARSLLDRLQEQLTALERRFESELTRGPLRWTLCSLKISRGQLCSGYGYLDAVLNRTDESKQQFALAKGYFDEAESICTTEIDATNSDMVQRSKQYQRSLQAKRSELERRIAASRAMAGEVRSVHQQGPPPANTER